MTIIILSPNYNLSIKIQKKSSLVCASKSGLGEQNRLREGGTLKEEHRNNSINPEY